MADGDNQYKKFKGFKWTIGNEDVPALALVVDDYSKQLHICEPADVTTDWAVAVCTHPTVYVHSATTPASNYIKISHDGTDATITAYGATAINFGIGATNYLEMTATALYPTTTNVMALGTASLNFTDLYLDSGAVIYFDTNDVLITHSSNLLTISGGGLAIGTTATGINISGTCTTAINVSGVQTDETGLDAAAVFQHGSYTGTGALTVAYGTQTAHLVLKSMHISAAATAVYVFGDILRIDSSATSTGHLVGTYTYMSLAHTTNNTYAIRGRVDVTATAELGLTNALMGEINVTAGTITQGTGGSINGLHIDVNVTAGATIAQPISGILVNTSGIAVDTVGEMCAIKVEHAGGSNYLDYGLKFTNCFHQSTAVIEFDLSQGNTPIAIRFNAGTAGHIITSALTFTSTTGGTSYLADFSGAADQLPFYANQGGKSNTCAGLIRVKDDAGATGYINVWTD